MKKLLWFAAVLLSVSSAYAEPEMANMRYISVTGEASEQVAPDQAILSLSLVSKDMDLNKAKEANDKLAEKLVAVTEEYKIPRKKVANSGIYITPQYNYLNNHQEFAGYSVQRSFTITMDRLDIHERLLSSLVAAKIDQVNGVEFKIADPEGHLVKLRAKAVANAHDKAAALAQAAGVKVGAPISIVLGNDNQPQFAPRPMMARAMMAGGGADASVAPSLPGLVPLSTSVSVSYGLEP